MQTPALPEISRTSRLSLPQQAIRPRTRANPDLRRRKSFFSSKNHSLTLLKWQLNLIKLPFFALILPTPGVLDASYLPDGPEGLDIHDRQFCGDSRADLLWIPPLR